MIIAQHFYIMTHSTSADSETPNINFNHPGAFLDLWTSKIQVEARFQSTLRWCVPTVILQADG